MAGRQNPKSKRAQLQKLFEKDNELNIAEACRKIGLNPSTGARYIRKLKNADTSIPITEKIKKTSSGGGLDAFREQFDDSIIVPKAIERGIKDHLTNQRGEPDWKYDRDFREACGVSIGKWRRYADDYKHLQVQKDSLIIWGHPDIIDEMRRAIQR